MARPTAIAATAATLFALSAAGPARAAGPDCTKIDANAAATVLGVPKTRDNSTGRHNKQPPDNMDVLGCAYAEVSPNPMARTLVYFIYTPIAKDLESVFASLKDDNAPGRWSGSRRVSAPDLPHGLDPALTARRLTAGSSSEVMATSRWRTSPVCQVLPR